MRMRSFDFLCNIYFEHCDLFMHTNLIFIPIKKAFVKKKRYDFAQCALFAGTDAKKGIRKDGAPLVCHLPDPGCPGPDTRLLTATENWVE